MKCKECNDTPEFSDICGTCGKSGDITAEEAKKIIRDFNGKMFEGVWTDRDLILIAGQIVMLQEKP